MTIKRTSVRWRNEMNRPDAFEERILADLEARVKAEAPLEPLLIVQNKAYHYFEPIRTVGLCLTCHGPEEKMPENVKKRPGHPLSRGSGSRLRRRRFSRGDSRHHPFGAARGAVGAGNPFRPKAGWGRGTPRVGLAQDLEFLPPL